VTNEMIELFKKLNTNEKRNELSSLILKLDQIVNQLVEQNKLDSSELEVVKNYDSTNQVLDTEDDMLLFFYDDIWKIKSKILLLLLNNEMGD